MPTNVISFLVIDDNPDGRFILSKTLARKYPKALMQECADSDIALETIKTRRPAVVMVHRAADLSGIEVIKKLRTFDPDLPIIGLSGDPRNEPVALGAGANAFLHYDAWLMIGGVVAKFVQPEV